MKIMRKDMEKIRLLSSVVQRREMKKMINIQLKN